MSGAFTFSDKPVKEEPISGYWDVLIVDDEDIVHSITKSALRDFRYKNKKLRLHHVYSAKECLTSIRTNPNIAVILLDVVMEQENSGLEIISEIRESNKHVRIIIRTGQPGTVPERDVIVKYDIDGYREKSELTAQRLFSTIVSALRTRERIQTIEDICVGLEKLSEERNHELMRVNSLIEILQKILVDTNTTTELLPQFESALTHILNHYGEVARRCCIFLEDEEGELRLHAQKCKEGDTCSAGSCLCEAIRIQNAGIMFGVGSVTGKDINYVSVPIRSRGSSIGTLNVFFTKYTDDEVKFVNLISYSLSSACEKQKLTNIIGSLNYFDLNTKLPNKVKFAHLRKPEQDKVVIVQVTNLKEIATNEGLSGCDLALVECARALRSLDEGLVGQIDLNTFIIATETPLINQIKEVTEDLIQGQTKITLTIREGCVSELTP